jgi:hypothetical protein
MRRIEEEVENGNGMEIENKRSNHKTNLESKKIKSKEAV